MIEVAPLSTHIGAEIGGVDLTEPMSDGTIAEIRQALLDWHVVFFRDQHIDRAQHVAFAARFGEPTPAHPTMPAVFPDQPEILQLDNQAYPPVEGLKTANLWHTDVTFTPAPPLGSILRSVVVPDYGGDTFFADLARAYDTLSPPIQDMLDGLEAVHHSVLPIHRGEATSALLGAFTGEIKAVHPVIRVHPETGRKSIFVNKNFTSHIRQLSRPESDAILAMIYEHMAEPEFTVSFRWRPGSIAFWDNRATAHLAGVAPQGMHRSMERVTIAGDVPVGPTGFRSHVLSAS